MDKYEQWPTDKFIGYANNPRDNDKAVDKIAEAIHAFGFRVPIIAKSDGTVIDGHLRLKAAKKLGLEFLPVLLADDMSEADIKGFRISVNRMAELADWDLDLLKIEIEGLQELDFDIDLLGFDDDFLDGLLEPLPEEGLIDEDAVPETPDEPITKLGDVWILGRHRLMCGDSTSIDTVEKLMDGNKADIVFSSPPYNVGKTPNGNDKKYLNDSDDKSTQDFRCLLNDFVSNGLMCADYVFSNVQSLAGNKVALIEHLFDSRSNYADVMIWDKKTAEPAMARKVLNSRFEYVYIFSSESKRTIGNRDFRGTLSNVIEINSRQDKQFSNVHKATFPVQFALFFIENFTESSCVDLFGGTGTTLIACEKTNRNCYMMELDETYVQVILQRWSDFTGKEPKLLSNNKTFTEMKNEKR